MFHVTNFHARRNDIWTMYESSLSLLPVYQFGMRRTARVKRGSRGEGETTIIDIRACVYARTLGRISACRICATPNRMCIC